MRTLRIVVLLAVVLLPGALLAPVWRLAGLGAGEDDILYYFPARTFFHDTIQAGEWPWLNPWTGLGRPFAADPQAAVWYPFTWLFAVLPPVQTYPLSLWAHYSLALWGMYRLLRAQTLDRRAALFGAIAFAFCGFMLAHRAHFTMQHAAAWAPWVLWRVQRFALAGGGVSRFVSATLVLALQCFAGHVQIAALTVLGVLAFMLAYPPHGPAGHKRTKATARAAGPLVAPPAVVVRWGLVCVFAAGLFAIQWLPTYDYMQLCTRVERTYRDFVENSWSPASVLGWLTPMLLGQRTPNFFDQAYWGPSHQVEQFGYAGLLPLLLAGLALRGGWWHDARRRPWIILAALALLLALGERGPLCPLLYWLPGSSLFRCPARALLLVNMAVAALAATTLEDLGATVSPRRARLRALIIRWTSRPVVLSAAVVAVPAVLILAAYPFLNADLRGAALHALRPWAPAMWVPFVTALVTCLVLGFVVRRWRQPVLLWLLLPLAAADLGAIGWTIDVPAGHAGPQSLLTPQATEWMDEVAESGDRLWVVTGRQGWLPGEYFASIDKAVANTNMLRGIASLTDYGPLHPRVVVEQFGFLPWGETLAADRLLADTSWMRLYDVGWVLLCDRDRPAPTGCDLVTITPEGWRLYRNPASAGWAMFEDAAQTAAVRTVRPSAARLRVWADTWPDERGERPRLVISQLALPGWIIRVDGQAVPAESVGGLLAVRIPGGAAVEIDCAYFPPGLVSGALITLMCGGGWVLMAIWGGVERRGSAGAARPSRRRARGRPH